MQDLTITLHLRVTDESFEEWDSNDRGGVMEATTTASIAILAMLSDYAEDGSLARRMDPASWAERIFSSLTPTTRTFLLPAIEALLAA